VRLEFMVAPLAFGIGTGLTTLVGVAAGADDWKRAVRVAWIGGLVAFGAIGTIGWTVALLPESWSRCSHRSAGDRASVAYITHVAPFYCLFGLGLALYFASQGAGRMTVPFMAGIARLVVTTTAGWFAVEKLGQGPRRRVHGNRARDSGLWLPDRRPAPCCALATKAPRGVCRTRPSLPRVGLSRSRVSPHRSNSLYAALALAERGMSMSGEGPSIQKGPPVSRRFFLSGAPTLFRESPSGERGFAQVCPVLQLVDGNVVAGFPPVRVLKSARVY